MTVKEAAEALGISEGRVRQLIGEGVLDAEKFGGLWVVTEDSVEARKVGNPGPGNPTFKA